MELCHNNIFVWIVLSVKQLPPSWRSSFLEVQLITVLAVQTVLLYLV